MTTLGEDILFRLAVPDDAKFFYDIRNEESVRKFSMNTEFIEYSQHEKWFTESLKNKKSVMLVAMSRDSKRIGYSRFNLGDGIALISIGLSKEFRGKGYGTRVIKESCDLLLDNFGVSRIAAQIKKDNLISIKAFEKAGFAKIKECKGIIDFEYKPGSK